MGGSVQIIPEEHLVEGRYKVEPLWFEFQKIVSKYCI